MVDRNYEMPKLGVKVVLQALIITVGVIIVAYWSLFPVCTESDASVSLGKNILLHKQDMKCLGQLVQPLRDTNACGMRAKTTHAYFGKLARK